MYVKTQWVNNTTPINDTNLNKIEQGIYDNSIRTETQVVTTANTDLNDYIENGEYYFYIGQAPINRPAGTNGWLKVIKGGDNDTVKQLWFRHGTENINDYQSYVRTLTGGTWSSWKRYLVDFDSEVYYKSGDEINIISSKLCFGLITGGAKDVRIQLSLDKKLTNISSISFSSLNLTLRGVNGYLEGGAAGTNYLDTSKYTIVTTIVSENEISINITAQTAYSTTNNTPVVGYINSAKMTLT